MLKIKKIIYLLGILTFNLNLNAQTNFSMNGWQFHEYNIPKLEEAIQKAHEYGVNFFIFSHNLFRSVEGFLVSDENYDPAIKFPYLSKLYAASYNHTKPHKNWQKDLKYLTAIAVKQNIPYYLWIHEFDDIPDRFKVKGTVEFDNPDLFPYLKERYEKLLKVLPTTAGFVLTFHESQNKIFRNSEVVSKLNVPERIFRLTKLIYEVAKAHDKKLILRSFFYEPKEMEYFQTALSKLPDDIIVMSKTTFHEFDPFYPPDSMHGNVGKKNQIIEIDLGVEKALGKDGAYAQLEYIQRYVRRAKELGLAGMVGRARLTWNKPFQDSHEINLYAFSRFMQNPDLTVMEVALDWATSRFNSEAAPYIASALLRTEYINHHCRYHLGFWLTKSVGEQWDDYGYYFGHLLQRSMYKWTKNLADKKIEDKLYHPDLETYNKLIAEKDTVILMINESIRDLEKASRYLSFEQIQPLRDQFDFLLDAVKLSKEWTRAYFAMRMYMDNSKSRYKIWVEDALKKLEKMDQLKDVNFGMNFKTGHRYNIDKFILEMKWRMANRNRARIEDRFLLEKIKNKINVEIN